MGGVRFPLLLESGLSEDQMGGEQDMTNPMDADLIQGGEDRC